MKFEDRQITQVSVQGVKLKRGSETYLYLDISDSILVSVAINPEEYQEENLEVSFLDPLPTRMVPEDITLNVRDLIISMTKEMGIMETLELLLSAYFAKNSHLMIRKYGESIEFELEIATGESYYSSCSELEQSQVAHLFA